MWNLENLELKSCLLNWTRASGFRVLPRVSEAFFVFFKTHLYFGMKKLAGECWG